jgi:hypothetical protein
MNWPAFWTSVFTGVAAAIVGFGTATFGYLFTQRGNRRDRAERASSDRVARVQSAVYGDLARAIAWRWLPVGSGVLKVSQALAEFSSAELARNPTVALWVAERLPPLATLVRAAERGWLLPGDGLRRSALMSSCAEVAAMLAGWHTGAVKEAWFIEQLSPGGRMTAAALGQRRPR